MASHKQELPMVSILFVWSAQNMNILYRISYTSFLQSNNSLCLLVFQIIFSPQSIRNKNCPWRPCLLSNWDEMRKSYRGPSIDASCKMLLYLAKWFQRRFFRNQPTRIKNCLWRPFFFTDQDEISNLYRGPSIDD